MARSYEWYRLAVEHRADDVLPKAPGGEEPASAETAPAEVELTEKQCRLEVIGGDEELKSRREMGTIAPETVLVRRDWETHSINVAPAAQRVSWKVPSHETDACKVGWDKLKQMVKADALPEDAWIAWGPFRYRKAELPQVLLSVDEAREKAGRAKAWVQRFLAADFPSTDVCRRVDEARDAAESVRIQVEELVAVSQPEEPPPAEPPPRKSARRFLVGLASALALLGILGVLGIVALQFQGDQEARTRLGEVQAALVRLGERDGRAAATGLDEGQARAAVDRLVKAGDSTIAASQSLLEEAESREKQFRDLQAEVRGALARFADEQARQAVRYGDGIAEQGTRLSSVQTAVDSLRAALDELRRETRQLEGRVDRVADSLQVPPDESLRPVLLVVDLGERMGAYGYPAVRRALLESVEAALRKSPRRPIGVVASRGSQNVPLLSPDVHYLVPDLDDFRKELTAARPRVGEPCDRLVAIQGALDLVAPRGGRWRIVYVTCNPLRPAEPSPQAWSQARGLAAELGAEVWVVHLLQGDDGPSGELLRLATASGGQYVSILSSDEPGDLPEGYQAESRLVRLLHQSLDLSVSHVP